MDGAMDVVIRERREQDLPAVIALLADQREVSGYPHNWPLPYPVEQFVSRRGEERAWVAEGGGRLVGHVAVVAPSSDMAPLFSAAVDDRPVAEMSVLFVATDLLGAGLGTRLMETAVTWIRASGRVPALDVVDPDSDVAQLYRRRGWVQVGTARPAWLGEDMPDVALMVLPD